MGGSKEKAGPGGRRALCYLNSLIFRLWSISRRTCCLEPQWQWWMAAPLSLSISPLRESTGWKGCWDMKLVRAWHRFSMQREVLACLLTSFAMMARHCTYTEGTSLSKNLCCRFKGRRSLFITAACTERIPRVHVHLHFRLDQEWAFEVSLPAIPLTALRFTCQRNLGAGKV